MEESILLACLATFMLLAAVCSIAFNRVKLPPLIGYIIAGIIVANVLEVEPEYQLIVDILSNIGLVMLMFCIGMEIDISKIKTQGTFAIKVALVQLPLMVLAGILAGGLMGFNATQSICLGAIISGSSTAVVMAVLRSQKRLNAEHVEMLVLITIMEDIGQVIILSMITPLMAGQSSDINSIIVLVITILIFMLVSLLFGLKLVPRLINWVSENVSDEILTVTSVALAFSMALISTYAGLSMAVGAFLMGMMVASSRKSHEISHRVEPMRDLFMAVFFISIGMKVQVISLVDNVGMIFAIFLVFAIAKISTVFLGYWIGNETGRNGFLSAVGLAAMGEFAFIIADQALSMDVISNSIYTSVIGAALVSMIVLPFLTRYSEPIWDKGMARCPKKLLTVFNNINEFRSKMYMHIGSMPTKSEEVFHKGMRHSYFNLLGIIVIEVLFFICVPYISAWLAEYMGLSLFIWNSIFVIVNFFALMPFVFLLVKNLKTIDEMIMKGAERIAKFGEEEKEANIYKRVLEVNTVVVTFLIDILIILIVPNSFSLINNLIVLGVAVVAFFAFYHFSLRHKIQKAREVRESE